MRKPTRPTHLVIPDFHAHPAYDNGRAKVLGHFISELRPTTIVCLGDFADMPSLSFFDRGKLAFEGRRYKRDVEVTLDALDRLSKPFRSIKGYQPKLVLTLGNHEDRIARCVSDDPRLEGVVSVADLQYERFGWRTVPFLKPVLLDSIFYCHYFVSGIRGKAISGESPARSLCLRLHRSAVAGHSHIFDHAERKALDGARMFGLVAGCFVHPKFDEPWCAQSKDYWHRGVTVLRDLDGQGYYDSMEVKTMRGLLREYS